MEATSEKACRWAVQTNDEDDERNERALLKDNLFKSEGNLHGALPTAHYQKAPALSSKTKKGGPAF